MSQAENPAGLQGAESSLILDNFRRWGYLQAALDPFGRLQPESHPDLAAESEAAAAGRAAYCGPIGVEFMHIPDPGRRRWVQEHMEAAAPEADRRRILDRLIRADIFEQTLQNRYLGTKRFSLEGVTALIPLLDELFEGVARHGGEKVILGMSHRGRLNVMSHIVGTPLRVILAGFEDVDPKSVLGGGDVKYHLGATGTYRTRDGGEVYVHLVSNPSHLEAVDPVVMGRVRAKQQREGEGSRNKIVPIVLHGDAAFAGQGILTETLNLTSLDGFEVGGTLQVIVNNLIGFTTEPYQLHSSRFSSDAAKRVSIPIFHVNGEDPDAVVRAARMAIDYRGEFNDDVVLDIIGYRRHGHSEIDDPTITQPTLYRMIAERPPLWQSYAEKTGIAESATAAHISEIRDDLDRAQKEAAELAIPALMAQLRTLPDYWNPYFGGKWKPEYEVDTGLAADRVAAVTEGLTRAPDGFHVHPKIQRLLDQRGEMGRGERPIDFGMAEALAFGSLLDEAVPIRLSGQDCRRGTFAHRHAILVDTEDDSEAFPLAGLARDQAFFEVYDSMLSEAAVVGFEYGFSRDYPDALVCWEAQFGDFVNGAQIIIDQFITAGEDKWGLLSGLVMLLPHGFEGQGPEHSSARMERFLQLAAEDNIQVCQPSTAGQYFHLLRRQALRKWRKPLIVLTPKGMLRHKDAASTLDELAAPRFRPVVGDPEIGKARRVLLCSGKIGHELKRRRAKIGDETTAVVFVDQLYPFPADDLGAELDRHGDANEIVWVQEEPANMGALFFVQPRIRHLARGRHVSSIKRSASGSPATGSPKAHSYEQNILLDLAFHLGKKG